MDAFFHFIREHITKAVGLPAILSAANFAGNLFLALSDGVITKQEFHNLMTSANGVESLVLVVAYMALKKKDG